VLRLALAFVSASLVGFNRGERNEAVGLRTTLLVCLAAAFAGVLANLLLSTTGKDQHDFAQIDVLRLPLGILSGIGFIGAGAIIKKEDIALGVTTAATMWVMSVVGLCYGTGFIALGAAATALTLSVLWVLKWVDRAMPRALRAEIKVSATGEVSESSIHAAIAGDGFRIIAWSAEYQADGSRLFSAEVQWKGHEKDVGAPAPFVLRLAAQSGVTSASWKPAELGS
jgi:putative Mg2+ transporter-C (MgtC) family protein